MPNKIDDDGRQNDVAEVRHRLPRAVLLSRQRQANPIEIDFGALLNGTPTGDDARLSLETSAIAAVEALLRPTKNERRTETLFSDLKLSVIARGPLDFLFDDDDRLVMVTYGSSSSDFLPALTEQAMCGPPLQGPSETDGIRVLWDGRRFSEFGCLSRFAGVFASKYEMRLANGRTVDRWLNFVIETPQARMFLDFLHKIVPKENNDYAIDYGLSAMNVVSRQHLARCGQP